MLDVSASLHVVRQWYKNVEGIKVSHLDTLMPSITLFHNLTTFKEAYRTHTHNKKKKK